MPLQVLLLLVCTAAVTFVVVVVSIGLVLYKYVNARAIRRRQVVYSTYADLFARILLQDLPGLAPGARTSAVFKQYEQLIEPMKREFTSMTPASYRFHREMLRQVLVDFARDLSGEASERLIYYFYSLQFVDDHVRLLRDRHWWVRAQAAKDLGLLRTRRALAPLIAALEDPHPDVRDQARQAVMTLAGTESLRTILRLSRRMSNWTALELSIVVMNFKEEAIPYLIEALESDDQSIVLFAIEMLAEIGFVDAVAPLLKMARTYPNVTVRSKAIEALGRLGDGRAEETLREFIENPQPTVRLRALEALGRIGAPAALPAMAKRLMEGAKDEQVAAARAMASAGAEGIARLRLVADEGSGRPQAVCLQVLEEIG